MITNQGYIFLIFILNGILIGLLFDVFRILRKTFSTKDFITYIEDILFWIITGILVLYSVFRFNNGEIRLYMFVAILIGVISYMLLLSSHIIKINVHIINFIKKVVGKILNIIIKPFKSFFGFLSKVFIKPSKKLFFKMRLLFANISKKLYNTSKKNQKTAKN